MSAVIVNVKQGTLKGRTGIDYAGKTYYSFQGIPYAKPPVGKLRFKDPQPPEPWEGIRDATKEGAICYQRDFLSFETQGSEDCLFLNVYTPQINKTTDAVLRPVMFYLHGGISSGSGNSDEYGPEYLLARDVVLITINYRLGILGFLKLEDPSLEVPGNAGLKDMVMALRWVKDNIENFYGDPNNVTVFGNSAGSSYVHYVLLSPLAKGLFHRAIVQSGCVFNNWAKGHYNKQNYLNVMDLHQTAEEKEILRTLQELPPEKVLEVQEKLNDRPLDNLRRPFGPEPEYPNSNAFLSIDPKDIANINDVPILIGYTNSEGIFCVAYKKLIKTEPVHKNFELLLPHNFNFQNGSDKSRQLAQRIKDYYYKDKEPSMDTLDAFMALEADVFFVHGIQKSIKHAMRRSEQPIFMYRFCFDGKIHFFERNLENISVEGASHGDELSYLFTQSRRLHKKPENDIDTVIKITTKIWTNFAKYGNPNPETANDDEKLNVNWKPVTEEELHYVNIDKELSTGINPEAGRMAFWDSLYESCPEAKYW